MHILFMSDNFPPEVNAPASRTFEHAREWVREGHQITVITCAPNFPRGQVYPGYRNRLWQKETMDGIHVIRVWTYITANEGFVKRTLDYLSFMLSGTVAALFVHRPNVVVSTSPQFFTACAAYMASRIKTVPFVFELRDLWPESIRAVGAMRDSWVLRALERVELFLYRKAARVISLTESFKRNLVQRGISGEKIEVITNGVDLSRFRPLPKDREILDRYGLTGKYVAGYIGTHGMAHALETILDAAEQIKGYPGGDAYRFVLLGHGATKQVLVERAKSTRLDNIVFIDSVPKEEVVRYWSILDVAIIHLRKADLFKTVIPSKLFECMGMGIPVLHGVAGESAEIVEKEQVGLTFEPENPLDLCSKLIALQSDTELYARFQQHCNLAACNYDRVTLARKMLGILEDVVRVSESAMTASRI